MTTQTDAAVPSNTAVDLEFDLDVRIVESATVVTELMRDTSDNCGNTCESACTSC